MQNTIEHSKTQKSAYTFNETRDVPISHYVCQWWISQFQNIQKENPIQPPLKFTKKHRDQIRWNSSRLPFRQSGLWMTMKMVFHNMLAKRFGHDGVVIYKLMITGFLLDVINNTQESAESKMCPDLLVHCLRKIARRLIKIETAIAAVHSAEVRQWTKKAIKKLEENMRLLSPSKNWQHTLKQEIYQNRMEEILTRRQIQAEDCQHSCTKVNMYLSSTTTSNRMCHKDVTLFNCRSYDASTNSCIFGINELPDLSSMKDQTGVSIDFKLTRIEIWIQSRFETWLTRVLLSTNRSSSDFDLLINFFEDYQRAALKHYCSSTNVWDPIGYSRYILTALTIIQLLHSSLCKQENFKRLKYHCIAIPHLFDIFPYLVLPNRDDMIRARKLYDYFMKFEQQPYPDLLSDIDSKAAFGVCFAANSTEMIRTWSEIQREAKDDKHKKIAEVNNAKERYSELIESIAEFMCECSTVTSVKCDQCRILQLANNIKANIYECPIPENTEGALAVVFELQMPLEIRCYRDILWRFINRNDFETTSNMYEWLNVNPHAGKLRRFYRHSYKPRIKLVSSRKSISQSHYSAPRPVNVTHLEGYLFENSLQVRISPTKSTTLQTECHHLTPQLSNPDYKYLQFALDSTAFAQNQVIAQLSDCSLRLKPSRFIDFGSFRSGHRLQWWNLLCSLESDSLALEEESVAVLIMHSLTQYGSSDYIK